MDKDGRAYTNTLVDGKVYGPDGTRIQSDNGWDIVTVEEDVYKDSDYSGADLKENAKPVIMAGSSVITDGNITTARGLGYALDLGIELIRLLMGPQHAQMVKESIQYDQV